MLSEKQLHNYFDSLKPHFNTYIFDRGPIKMSDNNLRANILCLHTNRLLAVSHYRMSVKALIDYDSFVMSTFYNRFQKDYDIVIDPWTPWSWTRRNDAGEWINDLNIDSEADLYKLILISQKVIVLDNIHFSIEQYRRQFDGGLLGQETVYINKYLESKKILEDGIKEDPLMVYPFTSMYARNSEISLQEAARTIMLQHEIQSGMLAENEAIRVKFTNLIRKEKDISKLKNIYRDYETVTSKYGSL